MELGFGVLLVLAGFVVGVLSMVALALVLVLRKRRELARASAGNGATGAAGTVRDAKIHLGESAVAVINSDDPARRRIVHNL